MGFSKKSQVESGLESEGRKWVIAGIPVRSSLKPINTKISNNNNKVRDFEEDNDEESCSTTPTAKETRIPARLSCPPAPRKRRPSVRCNNNNHFNGVREFFTVPDLETVFIRHVEKAN